MPVNAFGQPIGASVAGWTARPVPPRTMLVGRWCRVEPLDPDRHAAGLFTSYSAASDGRDWTYLATEHQDNEGAFREALVVQAASCDPLHYAIVERAGGTALGTAALMRIDAANGVIEIGHVSFSPLLQRTTAGTEAIALLMARVFDELGYRRLEWKCDALNAPSRRTAERLGFVHEGVFRQAIVTKGRNRDTAWYAMIDRDWAATRTDFAAWLSPSNFDDTGRQRRSLAVLRAQSYSKGTATDVGA